MFTNFPNFLMRSHPFGVPPRLTEQLTKGHEIVWPYKDVVRAIPSAKRDFRIVVNGVEYECARLVAAAVCPAVLAEFSKNSELATFEVAWEGAAASDVEDALKGNVDAGPFKKLTFCRFARAVKAVKPLRVIETSNKKYFVHDLFLGAFCKGEVPEKIETDVDLSEAARFLCGENIEVFPDNIDVLEAGVKILGIEVALNGLELIRKKHESLKRILAVISIENWLFDLTEERYEETLQVVQGSDFYKCPENHHVIIEAVLQAAYVRPLQSELFRNLMLKLAEDEAFRKNVKDVVLPRCSSCYSSQWLVRQLMDNGLFSEDDLVHELTAVPRSDFGFLSHRTDAVNVAGFLPELLVHSREATEKMLQSMKNNRGYFPFSAVPSIPDDINLEADPLPIDKLKEKLKYGRDPDPLIATLYTDDAQKLQQLTGENASFDFSTQFKGYLFDRTREFWNRNGKDYRLADAAIFYNAEQCLNFIAVNTSVQDSDFLNYACMAGNTRWIRDLHSNGIQLEHRHLRSALKYHRNDLFAWILEDALHLSIPRSHQMMGSPQRTFDSMAIDFGNTEAFLMLLEMHDGRDRIKPQTSYEKTSLFQATATGHTEMVRFLLQYRDINVNQADTMSNDVPPLCRAIKAGYKTISKLLINDPRTELDIRVSGEMPLDFAIKRQDLEIAQLLISRMSPETVKECVSKHDKSDCAFIEHLLPS